MVFVSMRTRTGSESSLDDRVLELFVHNSTLVFLESVLVLVAVWYGLAHGLGLVTTTSSPELVFQHFIELLSTGAWFDPVASSTKRVLMGFVGAALLGTVAGITLGLSDFWETALQDYLRMGLAVPSLLVVVFAAMWFGTSSLTPAVAAMVIATPFMTENVYAGVDDLDLNLVEMSKSFDVSQGRILKRLVFNAVLPEWFAGLRYAFAMSWKITTLAELVIGTGGIGYQIAEAMSLLSITDVLTWTLFIALIIMFVEYGIFNPIESHVFDWRQDNSIGWA